MRRFAFCLYLLGCLLSPGAMADEFRPALLEITETEPGWYSVMWKVPTQTGRRLAISPVLPAHIKQMGPASSRVFQGSVIEESSWSTDDGLLIGGTIEIAGLTAIPIDVILQLSLIHI
mgnify:FL=1